MQGNQVLVIHPYCERGIWMFDDHRETGGLDGKRQLQGEPFIGEINDMIDDMVRRAGVRNPKAGFTAYFSPAPIRGAHLVMRKVSNNRSPREGTDYAASVGGEVKVGWLCPALAKYFIRVPDAIYVRAESMPQPSWLSRLCPRFL